MPEKAEAAITLDDLDRVIGNAELMPPGTEVRALGRRQYGLIAPGMDGEAWITTSPAVYEEHAENMELWSVGNPVFTAWEMGTSEPTFTTGATLKNILDGEPR